jgi:hypothetical protein
LVDLDYKKLFIYLIIILAAAGYWYKSDRDEKKRAEASERFAEVYAAASVMAELYRSEPERFMTARDSIYELYNFNADSIEAFRQTFEKREDEWTQVWIVIKNKTDSLIEYFKANPVEHSVPDSIDMTVDSIGH